MDNATKEKIRFFTEALRNRLGENLKQIILFGSRARGDYWEGSDYDFIVIVSNKNDIVKQLVSTTGLDFLNKFDELSSELLFDEQEWERQKKYPLGINVIRDGIPL